MRTCRSASASAITRVVERAVPAALVDQVVEQLAQADLQGEAEAGALVHQRRQRDLPAVADAADDVLVRGSAPPR